ncbi:MAG: DUF4198 domain-containing protein [Aquificaceae bacterium]|nr:DUF4198 domain-containing protein [Aquificaceae bacterium]MDW8032408.1 DUF4198 domain-containing protein [Aquificaceae bacterium]MDW8424168.1 DUF4198 domain-containing protein [Aquificaceae bacterium]
MKALIVSLLFFSLLLAHELWIERVGDAYVLYYGHLQPKRGEESKLAYTPENLLRFECLDEDGRLLNSKVDKSYPARLRGSCAVIQAEFSSGYWTKTVEGLKNLPKDKVSGALESWLSLETVRRIERWSNALSKPLSNGLELVALENPLVLRMGQKFSIVAYYKGRPLKDAPISHNGKFVGSTDEDGRINLRIRSLGIQLISVSLKEGADGVKADYVTKTFSLMFEVGR